MEDRAQRVANRRRAVFGGAVLLAGVSLINLCLVPLFFPHCVPRSLFPTIQQERFFFDLFGLISSAWLVCWICELNAWIQMSRVAQWLAITLLCLEQVILAYLWQSISEYHNFIQSIIWLAPLVIQLYVFGLFVALFTLRSLTKSGNTITTGLATLLLILPWLIGKSVIISGTRCLLGLFA